MLLKDYNSYFYGYDKNGHHEKSSLLIFVILINSSINSFLFLNIILESIDLYIFKASNDDPFKKENKERDLQDYQSKYIDLYNKIVKKANSEKESVRFYHIRKNNCYNLLKALYFQHLYCQIKQQHLLHPLLNELLSSLLITLMKKKMDI